MPEQAELAYLLSAKAVRDRAHEILALGLEGRLPVFHVHMGAMDRAIDYVQEVILERHPDLDIPLHARFRHFGAGGVRRLERLDAALAGLPAFDRAMAKIDLVVTSVLLDAGAGAAWRYVEPSTGLAFGRSEGLAIASLELFLGGALSSDGTSPRADADGLESLTADALAAAFQVSPSNPLVGLEGRLALLRNLARALREEEARFGVREPRPGALLRSFASGGASVSADAVLGVLLRSLGPIWPGRIERAGVNLGDVWSHEALGPAGSVESLVPFHKLSQWLAYSLVEPLAEAGVTVTELDRLTGLPEYRNGGLFLDLGVLEPKDPSIMSRAHAPGSAVIVEWRALTVALLDQLAGGLRRRLGRTPAELPLAKVLEGGTWIAGRKIALAKRPDGSPPLALESDGTVF